MKKPPPPDECTACGASIPRNARACPECGADERTGWRDSSIYDGLDLPDESWSDDTDEGAGAAHHARSTRPTRDGLPWYWTAVALGMGIVLLLLFLGLR